MLTSAWLLLDDQLNRAVIGAKHSIMYDDIPDMRDERLRNQEVINAPAHSSLPGIGKVRPPGVLDPVRVEVAVGIYESMVEIFLNPGPLLRQET